MAVDRRADIVYAARTVIRERGFHATRLADVGLKTGLTAPAVAYYFPSKTDLLIGALTSAEEDQFYLPMEQALEKADSPLGKLRVVVSRAVEATDWHLWIELCALALHDETAREGVDENETRWHALLTEILTEGEAVGQWQLGDPAAEVAIRLAALIDGLCIQQTVCGIRAGWVATACDRFIEAELGISLGSGT